VDTLLNYAPLGLLKSAWHKKPLGTGFVFLAENDPVGLLKKSRRRKKRGTGKVLLSQNAPSPGVFPHFCSFAALGNIAKKTKNEFFNSPKRPYFPPRSFPKVPHALESKIFPGAFCPPVRWV
jgi:hypothetical protein